MRFIKSEGTAQFLPANISLPRAVSTRGEKGEYQATSLPASELLGHPACYKHQKEFYLICWATVSDTGHVKEILYIQQLTKFLIQEKPERRESGLFPRMAERERASCPHLSMDLTACPSWTESGWGMDNFWVLPQVILLNGAAGFCGKEGSDLVLFSQKSWNTNAFHVTWTSVSLPEVGGGESATATNSPWIRLSRETPRCFCFKPNPNTPWRVAT